MKELPRQATDAFCRAGQQLDDLVMSQRNNSGRGQDRDAKGRWRKGTSGNPAGMPAGTRHRTTRAAEAILEGEVENLTRKAIELALNGDTTALRLCLERLVPPRKDRPVALALPPLGGTPDLPTITAALLTAAAAGKLTPGEAGELGKLLETHRRAIETADIECRLSALEAQQGGGPDDPSGAPACPPRGGTGKP